MKYFCRILSSTEDFLSWKSAVFQWQPENFRELELSFLVPGCLRTTKFGIVGNAIRNHGSCLRKACHLKRYRLRFGAIEAHQRGAWRAWWTSVGWVRSRDKGQTNGRAERVPCTREQTLSGCENLRECIIMNPSNAFESLLCFAKTPLRALAFKALLHCCVVLCWAGWCLC